MKSVEIWKFRKIFWKKTNIFLNIFWWFEGPGVRPSNSTWKFSAITREDVHLGLQSGPGRSIYDFWCKFCDLFISPPTPPSTPNNPHPKTHWPCDPPHPNPSTPRRPLVVRRRRPSSVVVVRVRPSSSSVRPSVVVVRPSVVVVVCPLNGHIENWKIWKIGKKI